MLLFLISCAYVTEEELNELLSSCDQCEDAKWWFPDNDNDGFGNPLEGWYGCSPDESWITDDNDCDDLNPDINPDAQEICDEIDNNCDNIIDTDAIDAEAWYTDEDTDGFGTPDSITYLCDYTGNELVSNGDDCNDTDPGIAPDKSEICNNLIDDNCNPDDNATCEITGSFYLSNTNHYIEGSETDFGASISGVPDFNTDGYSDFVVGSPSISSVFVFTDPNELAYLTIIGSSIGAKSIQYENGFLTSSINDGTVYYFEKDLVGNKTIDDATYKITGTPNFGASLASGNNGYFVVGSPINNQAFIYENDLISSTITGESSLGYSTSICDLNADGVQDFVIGDIDYNTSSGAVYIFSSSPDLETNAADADYLLYGTTERQDLGIVACSGDTNADGYQDLLIGAPKADFNVSDSGTVYLISGNALTLTKPLSQINGISIGTSLGEVLSAAGDLNADGFADIALGSPHENGANGGEGFTYIFYGPLTGSYNDNSASIKISGSKGMHVGTDLSSLGDFNNDGFDDILISAEGESINAYGSVGILFGAGF